ncbi:nitroreductase family protein [Sneathiella sp. P13V-1]|uniref:nitroreductase family protein n=1 Tax=Sneathiella sp. P13V-1 TaxID=2697366 RepID=UPI00187BA2F6|nr:nitroreductase family protein [Sneathiella sp. P13V-1]MBE7636953.1 nitroreductase family protein [Sneathiella sp. P13V-1]
MVKVFNPGEVYDPISYPDRRDYSDQVMIEKSSEFCTNIQKRHSTREFSGKPVPREVIENCLKAASTAPSGANHQPWHFCVIETAELKAKIREAAEEEERAFYGGRAADEWLSALSGLGTDTDKPFLEIAPYLIIVFAERYGVTEEGENYKNYYVNESVGIATGFLINALHDSGLATLTHTPNPMKFLNEICGRPDNEKPFLILVTGHPADDAVIPRKSTYKKEASEYSSFL